MRVNALTAGFLLTTALISFSAFTAQPAMAAEHKVTCLCDCPDDHKAKPVKKAAVRTPSMTRRTVRSVARREGSYYQYAAAAPLTGYERRSQWRVAPNDMIMPNPEIGCCDAPPTMYGPPPAAYGPPAPMMYGPPPEMAYYGPPQGEEPGLRVDDRGWSGGVGAGADGGGGGGGGFMDGFGQVHFAQGGNQENGPSYNNYGQSFQYNPSVAGPFQPRLMGGFAPAQSSSK